MTISRVTPPNMALLRDYSVDQGAFFTRENQALFSEGSGIAEGYPWILMIYIYISWSC